jgi:hypothetical protein
MAEGGIPGKAIIVIVLVFVALVAVNLRWGGEGASNGNGAEEPMLTGIRIADQEGMREIQPTVSTTADDMAALMQGRIRVLLSGTDEERRATAVEVAALAGDPAGRDQLAQLPPAVLAEVRLALLGQGRTGKGLNDPDPVVSRNCREALVGLWRLSASAVCDGYLRQGLAALEAGDVDGALDVFLKVDRLGEAAPPDLYRLMAEAYLAKGQPGKALEACRKALTADSAQFLALLAMARAYAQEGEFDKANKALTIALTIYPAFPEAKAVQDEIKAQTAPAPAPAA